MTAFTDLRHVLDFAGEHCRSCGFPATHYVVTPIKPEEWTERNEMRILAAPWCDACSPVVAHRAEAFVPPEPPPLGWFARRLVKWLQSPEEAEGAR